MLVALAGTLRFYQLGSQLWLDEISALRGYRAPFLETLTTFPVFFPNPLFDLLAHASLVLFGESAWSIRLPAAVFGVAGVVVFYWLARRCLDVGWAIVAGALLAVSYHHIFYSQDARGYTAYLFFALLATDRLLALMESMSRRTAVAYVLTSALTTYAHPFGIFLLAGQMAVALPTVHWRRRHGDSTGPSPAQISGTALLAGVATVVLYAPLITGALAYVAQPRDQAAEGPQVLVFLSELLEGLSAGVGGWPVLIVGLVVGIVGVVDFYRRHPLVLALFAAPLTVATFAVAVLGAAEIHPRYFLLALPLGYLVATSGLACAVHWLLDRALHLSTETSSKVQVALGAMIVVLACVPLLAYYSMPKQDYIGAIRETRELAAPGDRIVAVSAAPGTDSGRLAWAYYDADLRIIDHLQELLRVEATGRRVWVMTTLEQHIASQAPEMLSRLREQYELVRVLPGSVGAGAMRIYTRQGVASP